MVELTFKNEKTGLTQTLEFQGNAITGDGNYLYSRLKPCFQKAQKIDIIVSFLMESGVKLLVNDIKAAVERGARVRILTGNYLNITQPAALYMLRRELGDVVSVRFYNVPNKSFHPKAYIFHYDDKGEIYIGSSNVSFSALTTGIEWNYCFDSKMHPEDFEHFYNTFEDLYENYAYEITDETLKEYSRKWKKPNVQKDLEAYDTEGGREEPETVQPRGAQIEALYHLEKSRKEGWDKGITVIPTGVGKTILAAFDSKNYKRVLFVAHREEILIQAEEAFRKVRGDGKYGFFYGDKKDDDCEVLFATVQTLGKSEYLCDKWFPRDYFDYIVVDEFHHAAADTYKRIIRYFTPDFLLGLTATPDRLDDKNIYEICDYNVVYDVRLKEAVNKGWLVPFRYYGIYDGTVNYDGISYAHGKYDEEELEKELMIPQRGDLVYHNYSKYNCKRALAFCSTKKHAEYMAEFFQNRGVRAAAVYSGTDGEYNLDRKEALEELKDGRLQIIFSVDMFNEGLDVKNIDMVLFLRPTQSPAVFLQQLGRGLRTAEGKSYLTVLDFIGNYRKANLLPFLLSGQKYQKEMARSNSMSDYEMPDDCMIDLDFQIVDLFKRQAEQEMSTKDKVNEQFEKVRQLVSCEFQRSVPTRVDLFTYMDTDVQDALKRNMRYSPVPNYLKFLAEKNLLNEDEKKLLNGKGAEFINMVETTRMQKSYKMPLLLAFCRDGKFKTVVNENDIYYSFQTYYERGGYKVDMIKDQSSAGFMTWGKKEWVKLAVMNPVKFMLNSHPDCFKKVDNGVIGLVEGMEEVVENEAFVRHVVDAVEWRSVRYFAEKY